MKKIPFFSILIPTRNRPEMLKLSLASLLSQTFADYEVIVSDNSDPERQKENRDYVEKLHHPKVHYLNPPHVLNMHDNWEFGLKHAQGQYQGVLIDKTLFKQNALFEIHEILKNKPVDLLNYLHSGVEYYPDKIFKFKRYVEETKFSDPLVEFFSPQEELLRRMNLEKNIRSDFAANETKYYNFGKICFGFYRRELIEKIRSEYGRVFHHIACDYNSCAIALSLAKEAILYNKELLLAICNFKGNGHACESQAGALLAFLKTCDPTLKFLQDLPIPFLYTALHNICAYDYLIVNRFGKFPDQINYANLIARCYEDFALFPFASVKEREEQFNLLNVYAKKIGVDIDPPKKLNWIIKPQSKLEKILAFLFKKSLKQKLYALSKRITFDLQYRNLETLLR